MGPEREPDELLRHEVRRQLDLVAQVGGHAADERLRVEPPAGTRAQIEAVLDEAGLDRGADWIVLRRC